MKIYNAAMTFLNIQLARTRKQWHYTTAQATARIPQFVSLIFSGRDTGHFAATTGPAEATSPMARLTTTDSHDGQNAVRGDRTGG